eukprot:7781036-Alexandrium_andersonii.AAC.1
MATQILEGRPCLPRATGDASNAITPLAALARQGLANKAKSEYVRGTDILLQASEDVEATP